MFAVGDRVKIIQDLEHPVGRWAVGAVGTIGAIIRGNSFTYQIHFDPGITIPSVGTGITTLWARQEELERVVPTIPWPEAIHFFPPTLPPLISWDEGGGETTMDDTFHEGDRVQPSDEARGSTGCGNLDNCLKQITSILVKEMNGSSITRWTAYDKAGNRLYDSCCWIYKSRFTKVSGRSMMTTLKTLAKKMFDADTKAMVEAGYLDQCLAVTEAGKDVIFTQFLLANKKLIADEARAKIKEEQDQK
jgi:hypothetical protein